ncbi:alkaline phosphatase family protein [Plantactinospora sp. BC1]|uniref:alkaline phosphatase family protein n=1 Tax=Plantactinospora sp. BC1 TaxID=2108470 RepID=UPI000D168517|nr:nucleotide pyrophosphatase/phosphodiesterase family protein [Plantactinospora sp. BC1]AVT32727.1 alkaline phosphatase family protein [Plantactinospora sp. BC1]
MTNPLDPLDLVRPHYFGGSLSDVLPSALSVLGVDRADPLGLAGELAGVRRIAVLLVDGLGWYQLPTAAPHAPTLADLAVRFGRPLTCGFPSTTPTSLVSLGTGAAPGAHGVLGFHVNVPGTDRILTHIDWPRSPVDGPNFPGGGPGSPVGGDRPSGSWAPAGDPVPTPATGSGDDPDPRRWQPLPTQLQRAEAAGVAVTVVSRPALANTGLSVAAYRNGTHRGADDTDALATEMLGALTAGDGPTLVYGYHPEVDRHGHLRGIDSADWRSAVAEVDALVARLVDGLPPDAALLVTADHGQLDIPAEGRYDLDTDPRLRAGLRLVAGEARVRYLHTLPGATADVVAAWSEVLGEQAWVATREEAVSAGWFGPVPEAHLPRIGDVVVACLAPTVVLASKTHNPIETTLVAYHGSCTATEMTIPLLAVPSSRG